MLDPLVGRTMGLVADRPVAAPHSQKMPLDAAQQRTESADDRAPGLSRLKHRSGQGRCRDRFSDDHLLAAEQLLILASVREQETVNRGSRTFPTGPV